MREKLSGDPENPDAKQESQAVSEVTAENVLRDMQRMVRGAAGSPDGWGDNVKAGIARAARRLGMSMREAKGWWYRERGEPPYSRYLAIKARYDALCEREAKKNTLERELLTARIEIARGHGNTDADHLYSSRKDVSGDR